MTFGNSVRILLHVRLTLLFCARRRVLFAVSEIFRNIFFQTVDKCTFSAYTKTYVAKRVFQYVKRKYRKMRGEYAAESEVYERRSYCRRSQTD